MLHINSKILFLSNAVFTLYVLSFEGVLYEGFLENNKYNASPSYRNFGNPQISEVTDIDVGHVLTEKKIYLISEDEKYNILTNHFHPEKTFSFPKTEIRDRKKRSFQYDWLNIQ